MKTASQLLALALIAFLFATNVYRASTQSITNDEAFTYNNFVWPPLERTLNTYDANHHVLHSLLCKVSVRWFGLSEFGLRVPSLAGGLLFLISVWRLVRYVFGRGWFSLFALTALVLNPAVLDYLSAARGYGLALGFLFWGLFLLTRYLSEEYDPPAGPLFRAGVALGLSVASNLVFLVPAVAAGVVFSALLVAARGAVPFRERFWLLIDRFWGPAIVPAFVILALPLSRASGANFYYGASTLADMLRNLVGISLTHTLRVWGLGRYLPGLGSWTRIAAQWIVPALGLLILVFAAAVAVRWRRSAKRASDLRGLSTVERAALLVAGAAALSLAVLVAANWAFGVLYPLGRTGVYWFPLFTLSLLLAVRWLWTAGLAGRAVAGVATASLVVALGLFIAGFTTTEYPEWRYDAGTRRVVDILRGFHRGQPPGGVRIGIDPLLESSLNFYRHKFRLDWIAPLTRDGADGDYDIYVLLPKTEGLIAKRGLRPIYRDPVSEATVALPPGR